MSCNGWLLFLSLCEPGKSVEVRERERNYKVIGVGRKDWLVGCGS